MYKKKKNNGRRQRYSLTRIVKENKKLEMNDELLLTSFVAANKNNF